jgi:tetratricopeptide (TPR) repeat protein
MDSRAAAARAQKVADTLADAAIAHRSGDAAKAKRLYRKVLKAQPGHFKALRLSGALAQETGEVDEAIRLLSAAVRHAPQNETGALEDLGLLHLQTGEQDKAEDLLRRAVAIDPTSLVALSRLASTLLTCGRASEAIEVLGRAREIDANDPRIAYAHAHALLENGDFDKTIEVADDSLALRAEDPQTLLVKGVALYQLERHDEAEQVLQQVVSLESSEINAWLHLGQARLARGDNAGAIDAFSEATKVAPDLANVSSQLANAHNAAERPETAVGICDAFLERHPTAAAVLLVKTLALRDMGHAEQADELLGQDTLINARPIDTPARFDDVAAFNQALERVIREHPSYGHVHTNRTTQHGDQTGSLMIEPSPEMRAFARVVDGRIRTVLRELRAGGHGEHPWVKNAPGNWVVNAWGVVLGDQGHQTSHMHPEAWLSGVYYVAIPEEGIGTGYGQDGWIEFGSLTEQLVARVTPPTRGIQPEPGLLVTFPSYSFHRTIPFRGKGQCVSIAFDVFAAPDGG